MGVQIMKGEPVATVQGKVYLYHEEIIWLLDVVEKQKTTGAPRDRMKSEQMIEVLQDLRQKTL